MNVRYPEPTAKLIDSYMKPPGIGQKTATRLAFYTIDMKDEVISEFARSLLSVECNLYSCSVCGNATEEDPCEARRNPPRDRSVILVVEEPKDVMAMEKTREYHGLYHVLHGMLSPTEGTGPESINTSSLLQWLHDADIKEVITAINATTEGEATVMYLSRLIKSAGIKVAHLTHSLSVGSNTEHTDEVTLLKAIEERRGL